MCIEELLLIRSKHPSENLERMIAQLDEDFKIIDLDSAIEAASIPHKLLVAAQTDEFGFASDVFADISRLKAFNPEAFDGMCGAVMVCSDGELYSKTAARKIIFELNRLGVAFMGRPFVEATGSLKNLRTSVKKSSITLDEALIQSSRDLSRALRDFDPKNIVGPERIVAIHSSTGDSNTLMLWNMVKDHIGELCDRDIEIKTIDVGNGQIKDCRGCRYSVCKHFGTNRSCVYGGLMVEKLYPAIEEADTVVMVCPNYNDAIGANITAVINRLTALFRRLKFYDKRLYAIIVSGHSGSDALACQLISALNMNKTFRLGPHFSLMEIANDRGEILEVEGIEKRAEEFARLILGG